MTVLFCAEEGVGNYQGSKKKAVGEVRGGDSTGDALNILWTFTLESIYHLFFTCIIFHIQ